MKYSPDQEHGGFYGHVNHFNQPVEKANKGAILNARILWTFAAASRMYGEKAYLDTAKRAYDYILNHFVDSDFGGIYWELSYRGEVSASRKQIYALAFTVYAMVEYHRATGEEKALSTAISLFQEIESNAFDKERIGYTEALSRDWNPLEDLRLS